MTFLSLALGLAPYKVFKHEWCRAQGALRWVPALSPSPGKPSILLPHIPNLARAESSRGGLEAHRGEIRDKRELGTRKMCDPVLECDALDCGGSGGQKDKLYDSQT